MSNFTNFSTRQSKGLKPKKRCNWTKYSIRKKSNCISWIKQTQKTRVKTIKKWLKKIHSYGPHNQLKKNSVVMAHSYDDYHRKIKNFLELYSTLFVIHQYLYKIPIHLNFCCSYMLPNYNYTVKNQTCL